MNRTFKLCKYILLAGLPGIVILCLALQEVYPHATVLDWIFVIALAGFVGISTNAIAIRMLFRPKAPTFFHRQGLIPRNKEKIARKIAEETERRLLNIDTIMVHVEKGQVIEDTINTVAKAVEKYLEQKVNRRAIADRVLALYNEYADRIFLWLTRAAESYITDFISRQITVDSVWALIKPKIKLFFESNELKHRTSTWIIQNLIERIPEFAAAVSEVLDRYIEEQVWWKKTALKTARQVSGLKKETIAELIRDVLYSPRTYNHIVAVVEDNLCSVEAYLEQDVMRGRIEHVHKWIRNYIVGMTRDRAIPALREKIDRFLTSDESWENVDRHLMAVLHTIPARLKAYLQQPAHVQKIRAFIPGIIHRLNIKKIVAENIQQQDTEEFERMIMKVSGENFAAIEVLGGVLGMLAGVALKEPVFLIVLPVGLGAFFGIEHLLMVLKRK